MRDARHSDSAENRRQGYACLHVPFPALSFLTVLEQFIFLLFYLSFTFGLFHSASLAFLSVCLCPPFRGMKGPSTFARRTQEVAAEAAEERNGAEHRASCD